MRSLIRFLIFLLIVALLVATIYLVRRNQTLTGTAIPPADSTAGILSQIDREFTNLVARVTPSVVSISARQNNPALEPMRRIRQFLGLGDPAQPELGSGVIVSSEGHIITNLHVIAEAVRVDVQLNDGQTFTAKVLGWDPQVDLAVLKIEATGLEPLPFANSDDVRVGQLVLAIGNPLGLQETVTQGIVSGKGRRALMGLDTEFFQTDAAINPGNSGGPLVNIRGEIVGISNSVLLQSQGISFAIPSNLAARVFEDVVERKQISRPWFGAQTLPLTPQMAKGLGMPGATGHLVMSVLPNSPASRAGIGRGDILKAFNGKPLRDSVDIRNRLAEMKAGEVVTATIQRGNDVFDLPVTVEQQTWR